MKWWRYLLLWGLALSLTSCMPKEAALHPPKPARVALVLGAGAAKGFAHIGVLKVLESHRIPVHLVVGASAGSFVGTLFAYGFDGFRLQTMALALERDDVLDITLPDNGFIKGERLEAYVNRMLKNTPLEKLRIPCRVVATDIQKGEEVVFATGNAGMAVRASCSIPGVFRPLRIGERTYVDGGVVSPVPVDAARRQGADVVLAVDISGGLQQAVPQGTIDTILRAADILYSRTAEVQIGKADVVIRPKVGDIAAGDFSRRGEAILEGERAAAEQIPAIRQILKPFADQGRLPP